jgi:hypothetical protein
MHICRVVSGSTVMGALSFEWLCFTKLVWELAHCASPNWDGSWPIMKWCDSPNWHENPPVWRVTPQNCRVGRPCRGLCLTKLAWELVHMKGCVQQTGMGTGLYEVMWLTQLAWELAYMKGHASQNCCVGRPCRGLHLTKVERELAHMKGCAHQIGMGTGLYEVTWLIKLAWELAYMKGHASKNCCCRSSEYRVVAH